MNRYVFIVCLSLGLIGCGGGPEINRVVGSVTMDGEPLLDINVTFWPKQDPYLGVLSAWSVDDQGAFDIRPDPSLGPGRAGTYLVLVTDRLLMEGMAALGGGSNREQTICSLRIRAKNIPKSYTQRATTPFEVELQRGDNALEPLDIAGETPQQLPRLPAPVCP